MRTFHLALLLLLYVDITISQYQLNHTFPDGEPYLLHENVNITALTQFRLSFCPHPTPSCQKNDSCGECSCKYCENDGGCCEEVGGNREKCVRAQLFKFNETPLDTYDSFMMVTSCSGKKWSIDVTTNCSLGDMRVTTPRLKLYRPVTSTLTKASYRNIYCGICNGERVTDLQEWNLEVACNHVQKITYDSPDDFIGDLLQHKDCNVYFKPTDVSSVKRCDWGIFTECNMTKYCQHCNKHIEWACNNYLNLYNFVYKNVYCYICNEHSPDISAGLHPFPGYGSSSDFVKSLGSFNALLKFQLPPQQSLQILTRRCSGSSIYDAYKNVCRDIRCKSPFIYKNGKCGDAVHTTQLKVRYDLFLRFDKNDLFDNMTAFCIQTAGASVYSYVSHLIHSLPFGLNLCHVTILQKPLDWGNFEFLIAHVEMMTFQYNHKIHSEANILLKSLTHLRQAYQRPNDCMNLNPQILKEVIYEVNELNMWILPIKRNYTDPTDGELLRVDPFMIVTSAFDFYNYCPEYSFVLTVAEVNLCPLVNISMKEFNGTLNNEVICLNDIDVCLTPDKYYYDLNSSYVQICSTVFLSGIPKYSSVQVVNGLQILISFVCSCLSMVCLIITILTYSLFSVLRTLPGLNNMALSICLLLAHGLFTFGKNATSLGPFCIALGTMIHFVWLCTLFMMNVCSITMLRTFSQIKQKSSVTEKQKFISFGLGVVYSVVCSTVFITTTIVYNIVISDGQSIGYGGSTCFVNNWKSQLYMFALPVGLIILSNIGMFITVVVQIQRLPDIRASSKHQRQNIKIYAKLSTLTGMTWIFGFLQNMALERIFAYIFIILNASQGIFIMVSFICNERVYNLYRYTWKTRQNTNSDTRTTDSTLTTNMDGKSTSQTCENNSQSYGQDEFQGTRF